MGVRKKLRADEIKEAKKSSPKNAPSSGFSTWTASR